MPPRKNGNSKDSVTDEEYITVSMVTEMLEKQKSVFKDLMDLQEKNFKTFLQLFMETTNKRVDDLVKEVIEFKQSLEYTQLQVDDQKKTSEELVLMLKETRKDLNTVCESALSLDRKTDYLEGQTKRNNIIIDGVPESENESWNDTESKVRKILSENLQMNEKQIEIERAHRAGDPKTANRHRPIVVKFLRWKDKEAFMATGKKLKNTNIYLNEDYSEAVRLKRKELIPKMKAERANGNIAYIRHDRLIVHPPSQRNTKDEMLTKTTG